MAIEIAAELDLGRNPSVEWRLRSIVGHDALVVHSIDHGELRNTGVARRAWAAIRRPVQIAASSGVSSG
jgi:hypothetical protein